MVGIEATKTLSFTSVDGQLSACDLRSKSTYNNNQIKCIINQHNWLSDNMLSYDWNIYVEIMMKFLKVLPMKNSLKVIIFYQNIICLPLRSMIWVMV